MFAPQIVYFIYSIEKAPTTGRLHAQGYVRFSSPVALSRVIKMLDGGRLGHAELSKGSEEDNIKYCSKSDTHVSGPYVYGAAAEPGKRTDFDTIRELVKAGANMRKVCEMASNAQTLRAAQIMLTFMEVPWSSQEAREVRWYHGSTGGGKTRAAFEEFPDAWVSNKNGTWFDGYDGHEVAILDDVRGDFCEFHVWLRLLDRYPFAVPYKGGFRQWKAKVIIVTCPWKPEYLFESRSEEDLQQIMRRISEVRLFGTELPPRVHYSVGPMAPFFRPPPQ